MKILENENLIKHTTFHLGGPARYFCEVENVEELKEALEFASSKGVSYFVLGGGSNVVADDNGYSGLVIKIKYDKWDLWDEDDGEYDKHDKSDIYHVEVGAGVNLAKVVSECEKNKLVGMEWAWGIPGTIGGAVRGNAGAYGGEMKDSIISVKVLRDGKIIELQNQDCEFGYRESIFKKNGDIILSAKIKLSVGDRTNRTDRTNGTNEKIRKERAEKFGGGYSAGSFFKNILMSEEEIKNFKNKFPDFPDQFVGYKKIPAAWLIEQCNLKGFFVGEVGVSEKHAGIIINRGKGTSDELTQLVSLIKTKVRSKFGVELEEEIQYLR